MTKKLEKALDKETSFDKTTTLKGKVNKINRMI